MRASATDEVAARLQGDIFASRGRKTSKNPELRAQPRKSPAGNPPQSRPRFGARLARPRSRKAGGPASRLGPPIAACIDKPSSVPVAQWRPFLWACGCPQAQARDPLHGPRTAGVRLGRTEAACTCTRWGLPCPVGHPPGGALLPHRFTLTSGRGRWRSILCGTVPDPAAGRWVLPTTVSCRARTFLPGRESPPERPPRRTRSVARPSTPSSHLCRAAEPL